MSSSHTFTVSPSIATVTTTKEVTRTVTATKIIFQTVLPPGLLAGSGNSEKKKNTCIIIYIMCYEYMQMKAYVYNG